METTNFSLHFINSWQNGSRVHRTHHHHHHKRDGCVTRQTFRPIVPFYRSLRAPLLAREAERDSESCFFVRAVGVHRFIRRFYQININLEISSIYWRQMKLYRKWWEEHCYKLFRLVKTFRSLHLGLGGGTQTPHFVLPGRKKITIIHIFELRTNLCVYDKKIWQ